MKSTYPYRLPIVLRLFMLGMAGVFVLGTHGYIDDSFRTDGINRALALWIFTSLLLLSIFSPLRSKVIVDDRGVTIPSIWIPPFRETHIPYRDMLDVDTQPGGKGNMAFVIWTATGKRKIWGSFVTSRKLNWGAPDEFWDLAEEVAARYDASGHYDEERARNIGWVASMKRVDHKAGLLVTAGLLAGLWFGIYQQVKDPEPSAAIPLVQAGWQALKHGNDAVTASARFREAVAADPSHADAYFGLAFALEIQGDLAGTVTNYRKAVELYDPPYVFAYGNLGLALLMQGDAEEGHAMLLQALEIDPGNPVVLGNLAGFHCDREEFGRAQDYVSRILALNRPVPPQMMGALDARCMPQSRP